MSGTPQCTPRQRLVPLPRSLAELQQAASLQFHHVGRLRVYGRDGREVVTKTGLKDLGDGDTLIIDLDKRGIAMGQKTLAPIKSTHQEAFINHGDFCRPKPTMSDDSAITQQSLGKKFNGESSYVNDYPRRPRLDPPQVDKQCNDNFPKYSDAPIEQTAYSQHFRAYQGVVPPQALGSDYESVLTSLTKRHAFTGRSSYADSFAARDEPMPPPIKVGVANKNDSTLSKWVMGLPLEDGTSSYQDHFPRPPLTDRRVSARPDRSIPEPRVFAGCSEYRNQFVPHAVRIPQVRIQLK